MHPLDKVGEKFKGQMWVEMERLYGEKYYGLPIKNDLETAQGRTLLTLKDEITEAFNHV